MRIRPPEWLYKDPAKTQYSNSDLSLRELGRVVTAPLYCGDTLAKIEPELESPLITSEQQSEPI